MQSMRESTTGSEAASAGIDHDWLTHTLGADATYIARLTLEGKEAEATEYIHRTDYLTRLATWKAGK